MTEKTDENTPEVPVEQKQCNGNAYLLGGVGLGAFGSTLALGANFVCPVCLIGTPFLLGYGGWQKYKYLRDKNNK